MFAAVALLFGVGQADAVGCGGCGKAPADGKNTKAAPACAKCCAADAKGHDHGAKAPAGKEAKLTGTLVCAKCKLKMEGVNRCTNALQVKDGEKTVTYLLDDKGMEEEYHECGKGEKKDVTVVGSVAEKDGKKWVKPTKVDYAKK
jgi:hypothetical protein